MTSAQVVETSVIDNNSSFQNYNIDQRKYRPKEKNKTKAIDLLRKNNRWGFEVKCRIIYSSVNRFTWLLNLTAKTCKYYQELGDILGYKPGVNPVSTASSSGKGEINMTEDGTNLNIS